MSKPHPILIGVLAGLAAALLYFSSYMVGMLGKLPLYIAPLPIYLAIFSFGSLSGIVATLTALGIALMLAPSLAVATVGAIIAFPALLIGYQATLAQGTSADGEKDADSSPLTWFPLENLLFNLAIAIGCGVLVIGAISGFSSETIVPVIVKQMQEITRINPELKSLNEADLINLAQTFAKLVPFFYPSIWLVTHVINAHLAAAISRNYKRMQRPADDMPVDLSLPLGALVALPTAMILMLFGTGVLASIAAVFSGVLFMAFAIVGLGALHLRLRGRQVARPMLIITYLIIFLFSFPLLIFAIAGVARSISRLGNPANSNRPNSTV
ncbi:MAG: hypothetical protein COB78_09130 [Hyphomicrobiales bacterium]|nr:MAG: hypothetical protein COB78_09130 [Hyphomicrobiales bacterium]